MNQNLAPLVGTFGDLRVLVLGDAMLDVYLNGSTSRLCREAPVPIVALDGGKQVPGGAANTAANVAGLGAQVRLLSVLGDDVEGRQLQEAMRQHAVSPDESLVVTGRGTLTKTRVVAGSQMLLRLDQGSTGQLSLEDCEAMAARLEEAYAWADAVIVSDYGYGVVSPLLLEKLAGLRQEQPKPLVVDAKDLTRYRALQPSAIKPNYEEVVRLLGLSPSESGLARREAVAGWGERVLELTGAQVAAVTLDRDGALIFERGRPAYRTYATPVNDSRAAGAGDTFVSALALAFAAGADTPAAAEIASAAANVVVRRDGTSVCSAGELQEALSGGEKLAGDAHRLAQRLQDLRRRGKRIVFTNGCFDIIHRGHITYLNAAKALGDVLVVGVNSDESVAKLKGPERPINCLEDRLQILAALSCIDFLIPFYEDTPVALIEEIRPDVFVKGGDYTLETLPEASLVQSLGGRVEILPYVEDRSTTNIIGRIRAASGVE
jgi:D-beta-D-heptose 7-phosphate kinase/D-beta-D-heptose 1-phosphate adenosyltransferase